MIMREFAGVTTYIDDVKVEEHFKLIEESDEYAVLLGCKLFEHEEEDLNFKYKYGIAITDLGRATGEQDNTVVVELLLIPSPTSIHPEVGDERLGDDSWEYYDLVTDSFVVKMGEEMLDVPWNGVSRFASEEVKEVVRTISASYECIDRFRGMYLDRPWNRIGTNGWDMLHHVINNKPLFNF